MRVQAGMGAAVFHAWSQRLAPDVQVGPAAATLQKQSVCIPFLLYCWPGSSIHSLYV
jgi:hypothetical protein